MAAHTADRSGVGETAGQTGTLPVVLDDGESRRAELRRPGAERHAQRQSVARAVAQFVLTGVAAVALVGLVSVRILQRTGEREAIRDARQEAGLAGRGIVAPATQPGVFAATPSAIARLDAVVRRDILREPVVQVKLWDATGRILYASEPRLIGQRYALDDGERLALRTGGADAGVSDLAKPENRFERRYRKLLEVYIGITGPGHRRLLYEEYLRYASVAASGNRLWRAFGPLLIVTVVLLELGQVPLAFSLARRLRRRQEERETLLRRAIDASEAERRRIARDLHDGAVQNLVGVSYTLAAAARGPETLPDGTSAVIDRAAAETRESIRELRALLVDIYPPTLHRAGLSGVLTDLAASLEARGITTRLVIEPDGIPAGAEPVLYRVAQEALRNVARHAQARTVTVTIARPADRTVLTVEDDGVGFSPGATRGEHGGGHFGLRMLGDLAREAGGRLTVRSAEGRGTVVELSVPDR